jgi:hypothetical protein
LERKNFDSSKRVHKQEDQKSISAEKANRQQDSKVQNFYSNLSNSRIAYILPRSSLADLLEMLSDRLVREARPTLAMALALTVMVGTAVLMLVPTMATCKFVIFRNLFLDFY